MTRTRNSQFRTLLTLLPATLAAASFNPVLADYTVTCESQNDRFEQCRIGEHGYVRVERQLSREACIKGRSWDYDRTRIWVDDGCGADFLVEDREHSGSHHDHDAGKVVAAAAGLAILGALVAASKESHDKHNDDDYYGSRHSSYIPGWLRGNWIGYNMVHDEEVRLSVADDGLVSAAAAGQKIRGYINDMRLYVADAEFRVERAGNGFNTIEVGNNQNKVHYHRE